MADAALEDELEHTVCGSNRQKVEHHRLEWKEDRPEGVEQESVGENQDEDDDHREFVLELVVEVHVAGRRATNVDCSTGKGTRCLLPREVAHPSDHVLVRFRPHLML